MEEIKIPKMEIEVPQIEVEVPKLKDLEIEEEEEEWKKWVMRILKKISQNK